MKGLVVVTFITIHFAPKVFSTCESRALCVSYTLLAECARYGRRKALLGTQWSSDFRRTHNERTEAEQRGDSFTPERAMFRAVLYGWVDPLCSYLDHSHLFIAHAILYPCQGPETGKTKHQPSFDAPPLRLPWWPVADIRELTRTMFIKERMLGCPPPPSVQVDGVDVAGRLRDQPKTYTHNRFE